MPYPQSLGLSELPDHDVHELVLHDDDAANRLTCKQLGDALEPLGRRLQGLVIRTLGGLEARPDLAVDLHDDLDLVLDRHRQIVGRPRRVGERRRVPEARPELFGKLPAFLTGFISLTVGFSAPIAFTSLVIVDLVVRGWSQLEGKQLQVSDFRLQLIAAFIPVILALFHIARVKVGEGMQNSLTAIKTLLIFVIAIALFFTSAPAANAVQVAQAAPEFWKWGGLVLTVMLMQV